MEHRDYCRLFLKDHVLLCLMSIFVSPTFVANVILTGHYNQEKNVFGNTYQIRRRMYLMCVLVCISCHRLRNFMLKFWLMFLEVYLLNKS